MSKPTTPWAHLPNAALIDWCAADAKRRPEVWDATWAATKIPARADAWAAAWDGVWEVRRGTVWDDVRGSARAVTWDAIYALIAWDDCAQLLDAPVEAVRLMAVAGHHPAVLLLPAVIVRNTP